MSLIALLCPGFHLLGSRGGPVLVQPGCVPMPQCEHTNWGGGEACAPHPPPSASSLAPNSSPGVCEAMKKLAPLPASLFSLPPPDEGQALWLRIPATALGLTHFSSWAVPQPLANPDPLPPSVGLGTSCHHHLNLCVSVRHRRPSVSRHRPSPPMSVP